MTSASAISGESALTHTPSISVVSEGRTTVREKGMISSKSCSEMVDGRMRCVRVAAEVVRRERSAWAEKL